MFTYNIQFAGYPFDKVDEMGQTNFKSFAETFDSFPWMDQLDEYQKLKEGCSATISVKNVNDENDFWISIAGERNANIFLVGLVYLKAKKGLFGFGKGKSVKWVDIFEIEDRDKIKFLFNLFFDNQIDKLQEELSMLTKFDSMEAVTN